MDKDFSELVEYLDGKFTKIDDRFEKIDVKLIELEENVEGIKSLMVTKEEFNDLQTSVDAYAKKADTYFQEMLMLAQKVDRHEKWLQLIAEKIGVKLPY